MTARPNVPGRGLGRAIRGACSSPWKVGQRRVPAQQQPGTAAGVLSSKSLIHVRMRRGPSSPRRRPQAAGAATAACPCPPDRHTHIRSLPLRAPSAPSSGRLRPSPRVHRGLVPILSARAAGAPAQRRLHAGDVPPMRSQLFAQPAVGNRRARGGLLNGRDSLPPPRSDAGTTRSQWPVPDFGGRQPFPERRQLTGTPEGDHTRGSPDLPPHAAAHR